MNISATKDRTCQFQYSSKISNYARGRKNNFFFVFFVFSLFWFVAVFFVCVAVVCILLLLSSSQLYLGMWLCFLFVLLSCVPSSCCLRHNFIWACGYVFCLCCCRAYPPLVVFVTTLSGHVAVFSVCVAVVCTLLRRVHTTATQTENTATCPDKVVTKTTKQEQYP
jgi:hypothetical protein